MLQRTKYVAIARELAIMSHNTGKGSDHGQVTENRSQSKISHDR